MHLCQVPESIAQENMEEVHWTPLLLYLILIETSQ